MATVIGIFEEAYKMNKPLPVVLPGTQSRRFTHIDDTIELCLLAWKKIYLDTILSHISKVFQF